MSNVTISPSGRCALASGFEDPTLSEEDTDEKCSMAAKGSEGTTALVSEDSEVDVDGGSTAWNCCAPCEQQDDSDGGCSRTRPISTVRKEKSPPCYASIMERARRLMPSGNNETTVSRLCPFPEERKSCTCNRPECPRCCMKEINMAAYDQMLQFNCKLMEIEKGVELMRKKFKLHEDNIDEIQVSL